MERPWVLITGGSSGIGASLVRHLAASYRVVTIARRRERMRDAFRDLPDVETHAVDLSDLEAWRAFLRDLIARHGTVPYAVSCAGSWNPKPVHETELHELRHAMAVDAMAHAVLLRELLPPMRAADFGRIVAVGGEATLVPSGGWALQYAAKMALNGFVVAAAAENRDRNVKINLVAPGPTNTEMYPGPLPVDASHPTVDHLLELDRDGPTGRMFWLGYELPLFPDLGATDLAASAPDRQRLRYVLNDPERD